MVQLCRTPFSGAVLFFKPKMSALCSSRNKHINTVAPFLLTHGHTHNTHTRGCSSPLLSHQHPPTLQIRWKRGQMSCWRGSRWRWIASPPRPPSARRSAASTNSERESPLTLQRRRFLNALHTLSPQCGRQKRTRRIARCQPCCLSVTTFNHVQLSPRTRALFLASGRSAWAGTARSRRPCTFSPDARSALCNGKARERRNCHHTMPGVSSAFPIASCSFVVPSSYLPHSARV